MKKITFKHITLLLFLLPILFSQFNCNKGDTVDTTDTPVEVVIPRVTIGTQVWMLYNLDVKTYRNGDAIPKVTDPIAWAALTTGAWCWYNNDSATYAATYGKLYNWYAVNDPRGLAPSGYHLPSDAEWTKLTDTLGGLNNAGGKMKEPGTLHWASPNTDATNSSGFAGLPGGFRFNGGTFNGISNFGFWWSSTEFDATYAWYRYLRYDYTSALRDD